MKKQILTHPKKPHFMAPLLNVEDLPKFVERRVKFSLLPMTFDTCLVYDKSGDPSDCSNISTSKCWDLGVPNFRNIRLVIILSENWILMSPKVRQQMEFYNFLYVSLNIWYVANHHC